MRARSRRRTDVPPVPDRAKDVIEHLETHGDNLPNRRGTSPYGNEPRKYGEARLPAATGDGQPITYDESYVNKTPTPAQKKAGLETDGERVVTGSDGSVWCSDDHYKTMVRVR